MDNENIENTTQDIGTFLIKLRQEKGLELMQIAQKTRININLLRALEETNLAKLPDLTYVKGFVKSYAKEVNADTNTCLKVLEQTYKNHNIEKRQLEIPQSDNIITNNNLGLSGSSAEKITSNISIKQIAIAAFFLLLALGCFIIFRDSKKVVETKQNTENLKPTPTIAAEIEEIVANDTSQIDSPPLASDPKSDVTSEQDSIQTKPENNEVSAVKEEEEKKETEPEEEVAKKEDDKNESDVIDFTVRKFSAPLYKVVVDSPDASNIDFLPARIKNSYVEGIQNIFINAVSDESWITYKSDDKPVKSFLLRKGRTILIRGKEVQLFTGNLSGVKIFLNNQLVEAFSNTGVKSLIFPHDAYENYRLPLFVYDKKIGKSFTLKNYLEKVDRLDLLK